MSKGNRDEIEAVNELYRSGKITKAQKKALIDALRNSDPECEAHDKCDSGSATRSDDKTEFTFSVSGMNDPYDASRVTTICSNAKGADRAYADVKSAKVTVYGELDPSEVSKALTEAGYPARPVDVKLPNNGSDGKDDDEDDDFYDEDDEYYDEDDDYFDDDDEEDEEDEEDEDDEEDEEDEEDEDDDDDDDDEEDDDDESGDGKNFDGQKFGEIMSKMGEQIKSVVKKSMEVAQRAEKQAVDAVKNVFSGTYVSNNGSVTVVHNPETHDGANYDDMEVKIRYENGGSVFKWAGKTPDYERMLNESRDVMDEQFYGQLKNLFDTRFVGSHVCTSGGRFLKVTIRPQ